MVETFLSYKFSWSCRCYLWLRVLVVVVISLVPAWCSCLLFVDLVQSIILACSNNISGFQWILTLWGQIIVIFPWYSISISSFGFLNIIAIKQTQKVISKFTSNLEHQPERDELYGLLYTWTICIKEEEEEKWWRRKRRTRKRTRRRRRRRKRKNKKKRKKKYDGEELEKELGKEEKT